MGASKSSVLEKMKREAKRRYQEQVKAAADDLAMAMRVLKNNADFEKLSQAEKRVAIAQDVLVQLQMEKIVPTQGLYLEGPDDSEVAIKPSTPIKNVTAWQEPGCSVCAKGALFVSAVKMMNGRKVKELKDLNWLTDENGQDINKYDAFSVGNDTIVDYLGDVFLSDQLNMIEAAFEENNIDDYLADELKRKVRKKTGHHSIYFRQEESDEAERMRLIMENVVKNKGTFKPTLTDLTQ